ncbi:MAG: DUF2155 domain-containing protein [Octadecabacter sp.]
MRALLTALALSLALPVSAQQATTASGGTLRVLDKITGRTQDLEFGTGQMRQVGLLAITMAECRYPSGNRSGDAYTLLSIVYNNEADPVFTGWMIASAPALNALDHPRYDVWALRCSSE